MIEATNTYISGSVPPYTARKILALQQVRRVYLNVEPCCISNVDFGGASATSYEILKEVFASLNKHEFTCSELRTDLGSFLIEECLKACLDAEGNCKLFAFETSGTNKNCMKCSEGIDKAESSASFDLYEPKMKGGELDKSIFYPVQPEDIYYDKWESGGYHNYHTTSKAFVGRSPTGIGEDYFPAVVITNLEPETAYQFKSRITSGSIMVGSESQFCQ